MLMYGCPHTENATRRACIHLIADPDTDYAQRFTGHDLDYDLICLPCSKQEEEIENNLRLICPQCFERIESEGFWDCILGQSEIRERAQQAHFEHEDIVATLPPGVTLHDIQPLNNVREPVFIALATIGKDVSLLNIDLAAPTVTPLATLPSLDLKLNEPLMLSLAPNGLFAAVANTRGEHGMVVDLQSGQVTMRLARGSYHEDASNFPLAFFEDDGHTLLVHGTDWSRLDISDPLAGALLTARDLAPDASGKYPERALDYFHGSLSASPNGEWIVDNGWVWHPVGMTVVWNLKDWLHSNVWESEDGPSRKILSQQYDWDLPCSWIDEHTVALTGYQPSFKDGLAGVRIFNATTGKITGWFLGPDGNLAFDGYLFSFSPKVGVSVWDVATGERIAHDVTLRATCYHHGAHCLLTLMDEGVFRLSRLR